MLCNYTACLPGVCRPEEVPYPSLPAIQSHHVGMGNKAKSFVTAVSALNC